MEAVVTWLHLIGITFWLGGIFVNTLVLEPSMKAISPAERGKLMGAYIKRFVPLAWGAIALVVVTGFILADGISGFSALITSGTRYGNLMLVKHILVAVMIVNGPIWDWSWGGGSPLLLPRRETLNQPALARGIGLLARRRNSSGSRSG
ncbi:MAG: CopD family protein [Anaerolineae bacterium]